MHYEAATGKIQADLEAPSESRRPRARSLISFKRPARIVIQSRRSAATKLVCIRRMFPL